MGIGFQILNGIQDADEASIISRAGNIGTVTIATNMAGRGTDIKPSREVVDLGGIHVIGTEHHAANRIDRQLIGRAARQGDPGSAQLFLSADDLLIDRRVGQEVAGEPMRSSVTQRIDVRRSAAGAAAIRSASSRLQTKRSIGLAAATGFSLSRTAGKTGRVIGRNDPCSWPPVDRLAITEEQATPKNKSRDDLHLTSSLTFSAPDLQSNSAQDGRTVLTGCLGLAHRPVYVMSKADRFESERPDRPILTCPGMVGSTILTPRP